jgi:acetyl esterase/lipase
VLLVHGGFWKTTYDRTHTRPMARALTAAGYVVLSPEYRRVDPRDPGAGPGGWPRTAEDVRCAAEAAPELLAGLGVEMAGLRALGHSAGGHLVLWLATTGVPLVRVVGLAPVCDLGAALDQGLGADAAHAFLGDADPAAADPMVLFDRRPSVPVRIVHGVDDGPVPVDLSRELLARHPWVDLIEVAGGHFELIDPDSAQWPTVLGALAD